MDNNKENTQKWLTMGVVTLVIFMANLNTSVVNLATSEMMKTFGASLSQIQWVISAFTLTLGVTIPSTGYLSERFGMKKVFIIAVILFTSGSFMAGISWNLMAVIVSRVVQGLGGAFIISLGMTILMTTFEKSEIGMVVGIIGVCAMAAPALGPTLGGYLIENLNWRFVFFINIPIGIVSTIMAIIILKESGHKSAKKFDIIGFLTSATGMICILYVLGKGNVDWHDMKNVVIMIVGCYSLIMFIVNELMISEPMLNLRLLKDYTFCMSNIIINVAQLVLFGGVFLMPVFLQQIKGLSAMQTGLILFPEAIATAAAMMLFGKLGNKLDTRIFAISALVLIALNSYSMSHITLETSNTVITLLLMVRGFGVGFLIAPVQTIGLSGISKEAMSNASALINTVKQVGASVGITIITGIMQHQNTINYSSLAQQVNYFNPNSMGLFHLLQGVFIQSGMSQSNAQSGALTQMFGMIARQAQLYALNDTMLVISIISAIIILPTLFLKEGKQLIEETS
ncbi:DHA2 family efflux MFS transporter permease subunit [Clostridium aminobutyricum]|uniref:DHA2 family efflux MFS transporter permease subunit n=1 Tax=Clostridium aminobutyricum TaxID=33953 RepID=A0A939D6B7_CLOAM|nr:DHA2 family efflux MFS transporter permease subunit [Clostridium aminobutyricum]MBN7772329.1 DHA2 family efflux MFS transporter permease subunit [Clostridium aminobutyricum]